MKLKITSCLLEWKWKEINFDVQEWKWKESDVGVIKWKWNKKLICRQQSKGDETPNKKWNLGTIRHDFNENSSIYNS
jgi:hypothetical protein